MRQAVHAEHNTVMKKLSGGLFLDGELNSLFLKKGDFIVTFPQDAHIPAMNKISDDILVRAVAKSTVPVISVVGHQTDFTLTDLAAD